VGGEINKKIIIKTFIKLFYLTLFDFIEIHKKLKSFLHHIITSTKQLIT